MASSPEGPQWPYSGLVDAPRGYDLAAAVCTYGFFMLSPNAWGKDEHGNYCLTRPLTLAADGTAVVVRVSTVAGSMGSGVDAPAATAAASDRAPGQPLGAQAAPGLCSGGVRRAMDARGADEPSDLGTGVPSTCTAAPSCSVARHAAAAVAPAAPGALRVQAARALTAHEEQQVFTQVRRMLRLDPLADAQLAAFWAAVPDAAQRGWGRLFRSPTLWEDAVKTVLLCNCGWGRTLSMSAALVDNVGCGAFPTPQQLTQSTPDALQARCGLGYRARTLHRLACMVCDGEVDMEGLERVAAGLVAVAAPPDSATAPLPVTPPGLDASPASLVAGEATGSGSGSDLAPNTPMPQRRPRRHLVRGTSGPQCDVAVLHTGASPPQGPPANGDPVAADPSTSSAGLQPRHRRSAGSSSSCAEPPQPPATLGATAEAGSQERTQPLMRQLLQLPGIGPYGACNLLQLLGCYSHVPCDSETVRHLQAVHGLRRADLKNVRSLADQVYNRYAPYQFLVYWGELWCAYEAACQVAFRDLAPSRYATFTGSFMRKAVQQQPAAENDGGNQDGGGGGQQLGATRGHKRQRRRMDNTATA